MEGLKYEYHKLKCSKCGRKILVEIGLIGVGHNAIVSVTCAECFKKVGFSDVFKDMETHKVLLHAGEHKEIFGP
jgi:hypothetical protein